jgi:hypothetical protein
MHHLQFHISTSFTEFRFIKNSPFVTTVKVIMKVYQDFTQTMLQPNIWGAFRALGLELDTRRELYGLLLDEEKLRGSAGFDELCSVTFPWTRYRADDVLLGSLGSASLSKST